MNRSLLNDFLGPSLHSRPSPADQEWSTREIRTMPTQNAAHHVQASADQVFLSPRVIDRTAFEEFGEQLRMLIEEATTNARAVDDASQRAVQAHVRLSESGPALEARIGAATMALAGAEARSIEVQGLLARASQQVADSRVFEARLAQAVAERAASFESALASAALRHCQQLQSVEEDFRQRLANTAANLSSELDEVAQRTHTLEGRAAALADRLASLSEEASARFGEATARLEALQNAGANAEQHRLAVAKASTEAIGTIERSLATRDALSADVAILCLRVYDLQKTLVGAVRDARQTTLEARMIEPKPLRRGRKTKSPNAKAKATAVSGHTKAAKLRKAA
jgi:hypothetical protein